MNAGQFLKKATAQLEASGIESARLDCLILLEDALSIDRANLIAHLDTTIPNLTEVELNKKIVQRSQHLPLAYIRGHVEFYGRQFKVDQDVLVPRPETEDIITLLKQIKLDSPKVADIGTGSGCIGITAALELPDAKVDLYDISQPALQIATENANNLKANVGIHLSDLLSSLHDDYDVILANLPYVPDNYPINQAARKEPSLALFAGKDGMDLYRTLWQQISELSRKPQYIITESLEEQHLSNAGLAKNANYELIKTVTLVQSFRLKS